MNESFEVRLHEALRNSWAVFSKAPEVFIGIAFGLFAISIVFASLPVVGPFVGMLICALGPACIFLAAEDGYRKEAATFQSLEAIPALLPQLLALFVVKYILIGLGFLLLVLPGIYLVITLSFAELYVIAEKKTFLDAMKASHALVRRNLLGVTALLLVVLLFAFSGALVIGLGMLVTAPLALLTLHAVFRRVSLRILR